MKTAEQIAQWVIDNRYPKGENNKVSDSEMYYTLVESIAKLCTIPHVVGQSEQLKAFAKMVANDDFAYLKDADTLLKDFESL